jgi:hypothetical protein
VATVEANTVLRKRLEVVEGDTYPLCIVAPGTGGEKVDLQTFNKNVVYAYPVLVAYVAQGNGLIDLQQTYIDTREQIRDQLYQTLLSGAATVFDTKIDPEEAVNLGAYVGTNYDVSGWLVYYRSKEIRLS